MRAFLYYCEGHPVSLTSKKVKQFRSIGHHLNPVVIVANGISENVLKEIERALSDHELIKIRVNAGDRDAKKQIIANLCESTQAELIQAIGHMAILYKPAEKPNPALSNLTRYKNYLE